MIGASGGIGVPPHGGGRAALRASVLHSALEVFGSQGQIENDVATELGLLKA
jgi:hypothetical protein